LAIDTTPAGSIIFNFGAKPLEELAGTCSLDVANDGPHTLEGVAAYLGVTRERIRQIEAIAVAKLKKSAAQLRSSPEQQESSPALRPRQGPPSTFLGDSVGARR
jgi:hypothetical protein